MKSVSMPPSVTIGRPASCGSRPALGTAPAAGTAPDTEVIAITPSQGEYRPPEVTAAPRDRPSMATRIPRSSVRSPMRAQLRVLRQLVEALLQHRATPVAYVAEASHQSPQNAQ